MATKSAEQTQRVACNVTPLMRGARMYYVEVEMLVPHRFLVAVPAHDTAGACQISKHVITAGLAYGIPCFGEATVPEVLSIKSGDPDGAQTADRIEPIPAEHRRATRNVSV